MCVGLLSKLGSRVPGTRYRSTQTDPAAEVGGRSRVSIAAIARVQPHAVQRSQRKVREENATDFSYHIAGPDARHILMCALPAPCIRHRRPARSAPPPRTVKRRISGEGSWANTWSKACPASTWGRWRKGEESRPRYSKGERVQQHFVLRYHMIRSRCSADGQANWFKHDLWIPAVCSIILVAYASEVQSGQRSRLQRVHVHMFKHVHHEHVHKELSLLATLVLSRRRLSYLA